MWTNVSKPGAQTWDTTNPAGKEMYDQIDLFYDDVDVFYDGVNPNQWTDVSKPVTPAWTNVAKPT